MLLIQYNSQLRSRRLISNVEHLIINPPLPSVFNLALLLSIISEHDCNDAHVINAGREEGAEEKIRTRSHRFRDPRADGYYFTVRGNALDTHISERGT